jgi:hypothetical protein
MQAVAAKTSDYIMYRQFNMKKFYVLPTEYNVLYNTYQNKEQLFPYNNIN